MGRIIALDLGTKRTGIAVSDPLRMIAGGLDTVATHELNGYLTKYIGANDVDIIVLGKPLRMDGTPSETMQLVKRKMKELAKAFPKINIVLWDERFTSILAQRAIIESGVPKMKRRDKTLVDKVSATIILQGYMASYENSENL